MRDLIKLTNVRAMVGLAVFVAAVSAVAAPKDEAKVIVVGTTIEKSVEPDLIHLNAEVWSKAATAQRAQMLAADKYKELAAACDAFKIKKEDLVTVGFNFGPEYVWENQRNRLAGFRSTQTLRITLRKTGDAGKFIDTVTLSSKGGGSPKAESGVNLNTIVWDSSKRADAETAGLADAIKAAREKADAMAKAAGVKIGGVHKLTHESVNVNEGPRYMGAMAKASMVAESAPATDLGQGTVKVQVQVRAEYEIAE